MQATTTKLLSGKPLAKLLLACRRTLLGITLAGTTLAGAGLVAPTPTCAIYCANCSTFYQQMF